MKKGMAWTSALPSNVTQCLAAPVVLLQGWVLVSASLPAIHRLSGCLPIEAESPFRAVNGTDAIQLTQRPEADALIRLEPPSPFPRPRPMSCADPRASSPLLDFSRLGDTE